MKDCKYCDQTHELKRCPAYGKHVESVEIQTILQLSVTQEISVPVLVQRETLDQRLRMQYIHQMKNSLLFIEC